MRKYTITKVRKVNFPTANSNVDELFEGEVKFEDGNIAYVNIFCESEIVNGKRYENEDDLCDFVYSYDKPLTELLSMDAEGDLDNLLFNHSVYPKELVEISNELYSIWRENLNIGKEWKEV